MVPTFCHRWDCDPCARKRVRRARAMAAAGKPERRLTLTTRPRPFLPLDVAVRWWRKCFTKFLRELRKEFGPTPYMAFLELTKAGWPHMHVLVRGSYMPQRMLSEIWLRITGSFKVHVQGVDNSWKAVEEASKYYLKTAQQVHAACPHTPVYTMSRDWLPDDWRQGDNPPGNYEFYGFCRLTWEHAVGLLDDLGALVTPRSDNPAHLQIRMLGPPDPDVAAGIEACADFGELNLLTALQTIALAPQGLATPTTELQDAYHYYICPWPTD
ncbi:hypothetical protein ES705_29078 [subsurface metagenome]